uniref:Uncharacterized protein n=1 Tax=Cacopsylla melanoneura TaxID=428564 RepID=A0A8D8QWT6_9HEMI
MKVALNALVLKLKDCKAVYLVQIIKRYDTPKINKHIIQLNTRIKHLVKSNKNVKILNTRSIKYNHLTDDGLHLNRIGKMLLTNKIIREFSSKTSIKINHNNKHNSETHDQNLPVGSERLVGSGTRTNMIPQTHVRSDKNKNTAHVTKQNHTGYVQRHKSVHKLTYKKHNSDNKYKHHNHNVGQNGHHVIPKVGQKKNFYSKSYRKHDSNQYNNHSNTNINPHCYCPCSAIQYQYSHVPYWNSSSSMFYPNKHWQNNKGSFHPF